MRGKSEWDQDAHWTFSYVIVLKLVAKAYGVLGTCLASRLGHDTQAQKALDVSPSPGLERVARAQKVLGICQTPGFEHVTQA